jgi:hypothetical protein
LPEKSCLSASSLFEPKIESGYIARLDFVEPTGIWQPSWTIPSIQIENGSKGVTSEVEISQE